MEWLKFCDYHGTTLAKEEIKHSLLLGVMAGDEITNAERWTLGDAGECALMVPKKTPIILGQMDQYQCRRLAELTLDISYMGVIGAGLTAQWFACRAAELGVRFADAEPQQIYFLDDPPVHPPVPGHVRIVSGDDTSQLSYWLTMFAYESAPLEDGPSPDDCERLARSGDYFFWIDNGHVVSMAGMTRRLTKSVTITGVYTPPELRGRGYASAITAALVDRIHLSNKTAILYTDLRVPAANRCYQRIGFHSIYTSLHFHRGT